MAPTSTQTKKPNLGNVVVIGGCGFLGHHIVNQLCDSYTCKVSVIDIRTTNNRRAEGDGVKYFDADITILESLLSIFKQVKPDVVIHTASPVAVGNSSKAFLYKVNVDGTKRVVEACQQTNVKALVYTSSASVISDNVNDLINADERWPVLRGSAQSEYYSETKAHAESIVLEANRAEACPTLLTASIRPAGIFGEGDVQMTPALLNVYYEGKTKFQVGDNDNLFDVTYVGNVSHGHLLAAVALLATSKLATAPLDHEKVDGEAFLITNGTPLYFWDFARIIWKTAGLTSGPNTAWIISKPVGIPIATCMELISKLLGRKPTFTRQAITFSCMTRYYNINKARQRLNYEPLCDIKEGVERAVRWNIAQRAAAGEKKGQ